MKPRPPARNDPFAPFRAELHALYARVDALLAPFTCAGSADCCHFGRTGREPYPTAVEVADVARAVRAAGLRPADVAPVPAPPRDARRRSLPRASDERRCPLLSREGRCRIYASRPFGCRTFFCDRVEGPGAPPRDEVQRIARQIADLSARFAPRDPHARPFGKVLAAGL